MNATSPDTKVTEPRTNPPRRLCEPSAGEELGVLGLHFLLDLVEDLLFVLG